MSKSAVWAATLAAVACGISFGQNKQSDKDGTRLIDSIQGANLDGQPRILGHRSPDRAPAHGCADRNAGRRGQGGIESSAWVATHMSITISDKSCLQCNASIVDGRRKVGRAGQPVPRSELFDLGRSRKYDSWLPGILLDFADLWSLG